jgi:hypothetical protein
MRRYDDGSLHRRARDHRCGGAYSEQTKQHRNARVSAPRGRVCSVHKIMTFYVTTEIPRSN